jgi:fatty acid desaturase
MRSIRVELPTLVLTLGVYAAWLGLTFQARRWGTASHVGLALLLALHNSLQHEHIHGHPTRSDRVNAWLAGWPLSLWLPFTVYRRSHREHHASEALTDPSRDAESYYVTEARWASSGPLRRAWRRTLQTLGGRLVLGPAAVMAATLRGELVRWRALEATARREEAWGLIAHLAGVGLVLVWLLAVCELSPLTYFFAAVYPGLSLTLLRSYAEHRPDADPARRTTVVESPLVGLLFLHNNLHVIHHEAPQLPWYALPRRWRAERAHHLARGVTIYAGYRALLRYLVKPKDSPVHPGSEPLGETEEMMHGAA